MRNPELSIDLDDVQAELARASSDGDLAALSDRICALSVDEIPGLLTRLDLKKRAFVYRLLPKDTAVEVFDALSAPLQSDLLDGLGDEDVAAAFSRLEPDDRASLLDELPASVANRLLQELPAGERELTTVVLGYPEGSVGRRMSPECAPIRQSLTVEEALDAVRERLGDAETVYTLPVVDDARRLSGVISLRTLLSADPQAPVLGLMSAPKSAEATETAEAVARRCADLRLLAMPIVDAESRLLGMLTVDDALDIVEDAESEDQARISGTEPLRRPYLATPVRSLVRSRIVWLFVLAVGATLTVQVLEVFESTLEQMVVLSLFVPLLIGTGGNTGNQAATTVTRALALGDVSPRDMLLVMLREVRVGASLGLLLGVLGFAVAGLFYGASIGAVIGLTLLSICTLAATVGGIMPLIGRLVKVDPAVFANPFITTLVDASGLIIYFLIARAVLGV